MTSAVEAAFILLDCCSVEAALGFRFRGSTIVAVDDGPVLEVTQHFNDQKTCPAGAMNQICPSRLCLAQLQFNIAIHYVK